jgi:release factor glutamine methyltransferase
MTSGDSMTIADALREGRASLNATRTLTPGLDAEVLLRYALGVDRTTLFARLRERIEKSVLARYRALLAERARDIPVAYLIGEREFMTLPFFMDPAVLVPRPETEILVEWAIAWLRERDSATVVDAGTGSGAIALSIAAMMGPAWRGRIVAADLSGEALAIAARNRAKLGLGGRVALVRGSLVDWLGGAVDLLLANLPYLRPDQIDENPELAAEPRLALDGGADGLTLIRQVLGGAARVLAPGGAVGIEIDPSQHVEVVRMARSAFPEADISALRDLAGLERHVVIQTDARRGET